MPALPKHQPQQTTWKRPTTPAVSVHYPSSHMAVDATKPSAQPEPSGGNNNKKRTRVAANSSLHQSSAGLQEADVEARHQAEAQGLRQHAGGELGSSAGGNSAGGTHYHPQGLKPTPVARALAGPTVHILVEGYVSSCTDACLKYKVLQACCWPVASGLASVCIAQLPAKLLLHVLHMHKRCIISKV